VSPPPPQPWDVSGTIPGDNGVLAGVEQGEAAARSAYEDALRDPLPFGLDGMIRSQAQAVIAAHDHLRLLRERKLAA